jgi:alcohol dehydrogenase (cytochrome c)
MKTGFLLAAGVLIVIVIAQGSVVAQDVNAAMLLHPSADSWPTYHGDYSGRRHSSLTQITPQNVKTLSLAWAFQTEQTATIKSSPLLVDGILYFTVPDNIWAVDARSGHQIWHYTYPPNPGLHIGHRGVAMYKGWYRALESHGCRRDEGLLDDNGAAGCREPCAGRGFRRLR